MPDILLESSPPPDETVADCIARLGTPPDDILREWIQEAAALTGDETLTSFDIDADLWKSIRVGEDGRLSLDPPPDAPLLVESSNPSAHDETPNSTNGNGARWFLVATAVFALAGLGWLLMRPDSSDEIASRSVMTESPNSSSKRSSNSRDFASLPGTNPIDAGIDTIAPSESDEVEPSESDEVEPSDSELELMIEDIDAFAASTPADLGVGLSLDAFLLPTPPTSEPGSEPSDSVLSGVDPEAQPEDESAGRPSQAIDGGFGEAMPTDLLSSDDEDDADLLGDSDEQTTSRRNPIEPKVTGVALPPPPRQSDSPLPESVAVLTNDRIPESIELQMPEHSKTNFQLEREDGDRWRIVPQQDASPIARLFTGKDDSQIQFQWLDAARRVSTASTLTAGRLRTSDGDVVYLRPRLDTDPIKLTLGKRDLKLKWNLQTSIPPKTTEIRVSATVPKDVELQWIEPLEASSPRSTRGVAMIRLKTSEATAVVVRVDVKTTNSLSLRLRFGARLDPAMPWQWTDAKTIRESFEAVTKQLETADAQLLNLDVIISRAKRMRARRQEYLLEEQRDRIDDAVSNWTTVAKRLAELDQLVAFLDAGASLSPELVVQWGDGEQIILGIQGQSSD